MKLIGFNDINDDNDDDVMLENVCLQLSLHICFGHKLFHLESHQHLLYHREASSYKVEST